MGLDIRTRDASLGSGSVFLTVYKDIMSYVLAGYTVTCDGRYGVWPSWLWIMFVPLFVPLLFAQFVCFRYCVIPYVQLTGNLGDWCDFKWWRGAGYMVFMFYHGVLSMLFMIDGVMDAFVTASQILCHSMRREG